MSPIHSVIANFGSSLGVGSIFLAQVNKHVHPVTMANNTGGGGGGGYSFGNIFGWAGSVLMNWPRIAAYGAIDFFSDQFLQPLLMGFTGFTIGHYASKGIQFEAKMDVPAVLM